MAEALRAIPTKTEPRCKLCRHGQRDWIDQLLLRRSQREKDGAGNTINLQYVLAALTEIGVENPNEDNIKNHWKNHVEVVTREASDQMDEEVQNLYDELIAEAPDQADPVEFSKWQMKLWQVREVARLKAGEAPSVTTDQAQAAAKILVSAKTDESTRQLLGAMGGAIGRAIGGAVAKTIEPPKPSLDGPDVIDVEPVEVTVDA